MNPTKTAIKSLYYITHVDNIPSIIEKGIFSHGEMETRGIPCTPIYDAQIVSDRQKKTTPAGNTLWDYANLYFQPRNPMMYRVMLEKRRTDIGVIGIDPTVMNQSGKVYITDGNAANGATEFYSVTEGKKSSACSGIALLPTIGENRMGANGKSWRNVLFRRRFHRN
jgi:hypothetical protein